MFNYRFGVGLLLISLILSESVFLLWRENYLVPNIEKRTLALEKEVTALKEGAQAGSNFQQIDAGKLLGQSQPASPAAEEGKKIESSSSNTNKTAASNTVKASKINVNTAGAAELDKLPGIGVVYANRIIQYREQNGSFKSIEDIKKIKGIGESTFSKIKDQITI